MKQTWTVRTSTPDAWLIAYGATTVAELIWIRDLTHPTLTMARVQDGLNGLHQDTPPAQWALGPEIITGRHDIYHAGELVAEVAWTRPPADPYRWLHRIIEGLNWRSSAAGHVAATLAPHTTHGRAAS